MKRDIETGRYFPTALDSRIEEQFIKNMNVHEEEVKEYFVNLNTEDIQWDTKYK